MARVIELVRDYPAPATFGWSGVDVGSFLDRCDLDRVACLLGPTLAAADHPPEEAVSHFRMVHLRHAFSRARTERDLAVVREALDGAGIAWVVLKGAALVAQVYGDGLRESSDLDLLVDGRDVERALDRLVERGAVMIDQNFELLRSMGSGELAIKLPNGSVGDLHWHPIHERRVRRHFAIDVAQTLARRVQVPAKSAPIPALDATDTVLYLCLHACLSGGERLLWAKDIDLALRRLDWSAGDLVSRARSCGVALPAAVMLARTATLMATPIDRGLPRRLAGRSLWFVVLRGADRALGRNGRRHSSLLRLMYRCTRSTSRSSLRELARAAVYSSVLRRRADPSRPWRTKGPSGEHPMAMATPPDVKERFFAEVRSEVAR